MSFILDALKKAESERSRASGPVLVDVRIAPPRRHLPAWASVLGVVLLANLAVLAWLLLRKPAAHEIVVAPVSAANPAAANTAQAPAANLATSLPSPLPPPTLPPSRMSPDLTTQTATPSTAPVLNAAPARVDNLPTQRDLQAAGVVLPALQLNLHVYDPTPAQRYVLLNGVRLTEGEYTSDGIKVEVITERGVVLEARGQRFLLPIGG